MFFNMLYNAFLLPITPIPLHFKNSIYTGAFLIYLCFSSTSLGIRTSSSLILIYSCFLVITLQLASTNPFPILTAKKSSWSGFLSNKSLLKTLTFSIFSFIGLYILSKTLNSLLLEFKITSSFSPIYALYLTSLSIFSFLYSFLSFKKVTTLIIIPMDMEHTL